MFCSLEGILFPFRKNKEKNTFFRFFMEHLIKQFSNYIISSWNIFSFLKYYKGAKKMRTDNFLDNQL